MLKKQSSPFISQVHLRRLEQLCKHYSLSLANKTDIHTLAEQLHCSERNVAKLMKTLEAIGWIKWKSGRGRGNKSELTILSSFESVLLSILESHCRKGLLSEASQYAEHFGYTDTFRAQLPNWLSEAQNHLKAKNVLITLVPYTLPELHPLWTSRASSRFYIDALFDTLLRYDQETGTIKPHLAHHYEFRDNQLWLHIRPDVYFHNGEKMTAEHVAACLRERVRQSHTYQALYRHIKEVETKNMWVVITMSHAHPIVLRILAEMHSSIYLEHESRSIPYGTGPFVLEAAESCHWSLIKNNHYFALNGFIDKAEFWTSDTAAGRVQGHIVHHGYSAISRTASVQKPLTTGCEVMEFPFHNQGLSIDEKTWIMHHSREFCHRFSTELASVANSITNHHQDKGVYLYHPTMRIPTRTLRIRLSNCSKVRSKSLVDYLHESGADIVIIGEEDTDNDLYDIELGGYVFQDDQVFSYYKWLLCSNVFKTCLSAQQQTTFIGIIDQLLIASESKHDFMNKLYRCEDWLIQQGVYIPLWRDSLSYDIDDSIQGAETDSTGIMSLKKLWFCE